MKIIKQFTPITLVIETNDDLVKLKQVLLAAQRQENSHHWLKSSDSDLSRWIKYLLDKIQ